MLFYSFYFIRFHSFTNVIIFFVLDYTPHHSQMASSTNSTNRPTWIRYANKYCTCGAIAEIKVSTSKEDPYRLLYTCKKKVCNWTCWCEPIPDFTQNTLQHTKDPTQVEIKHEINKLVQDLNLMAVSQDAEHEEIRAEIEHSVFKVKSVVDAKLGYLENQFSTQINSLKTENASDNELCKLRAEFEKQRKKDIWKMVFALIMVLIGILFNKTN